jgi:hypothetical protein
MGLSSPAGVLDIDDDGFYLTFAASATGRTRGVEIV